MSFQQLAKVKLGAAEELNLADVNVTEGENAVAGLGDVLADELVDELTDGALEVYLGEVVGGNVHHLLADGADLTGLSVAILLDLMHLETISEADQEHTEVVTISGLNIDLGLDQGAPLLDKRAELVSGETHAVKVSDAVTTLHLIHTEVNLAAAIELIPVHKISQVDLKDTTLQVIL